jgi:hypothetical protein
VTETLVSGDMDLFSKLTGDIKLLLKSTGDMKLFLKSTGDTYVFLKLTSDIRGPPQGTYLLQENFKAKYNFHHLPMLVLKILNSSVDQEIFAAGKFHWSTVCRYDFRLQEFSEIS